MDGKPPEVVQYEVAQAQAPRAPMAVELSLAPPDARPERRGKTAVFVAHGMGQQMPFETLDLVAEGLLELDPRGVRGCPPPVARVVTGASEPVRRLELRLAGAEGEEREVHVYEGYWAPLTEGNVRARDAIRFLFRAGVNGFKIGSFEFRRWLFGREESFPAQPRSLIYVLTALAVVAALIAINAALFLVLTLRTPFAQSPTWLTRGLVADLGTTFRAVLAALLAFAALLALAKVARSLAARRGWRGGMGALVAALNFAAGAALLAVCAVLIAAAVALPFLFYGHFKLQRAGDPGSGIGGVGLWQRLLGWPVAGFDRGMDRLLGWLVAIALLLGLLWWVVAVLRALWRELRGLWEGQIAPPRFVLTVAVTAGGALLFGGALWEVAEWLGLLLALPKIGLVAKVQAGLSWALVFAAGLGVRRLLIQYVGDVAAYVDSHTLDRFQELRNRIRDRVASAARTVYALRDDDGGFEYERVIVVGHSLGSVAVYDALNRLVNEDLFARNAADRRQVAERTPLLLTFGSPLDKIAFLFAAEGASPARSALSAAAQPLLQDDAHRPARWVNLYSPWDVIASDLNYFDPIGPRRAQGVQNLRDPHATTLLAAHTEYWGNELLYRTLYDAAVG